LPDVGLQAASSAITENLGNKHRLPLIPDPQRSVLCIQVLTPRQTSWQTCWTSAECKADARRQFRASSLSYTAGKHCRWWGGATVNTFLSLMKMKSMALSGNLINIFFARLKRMMQLASVSSCAWRFLIHFRRNSSQVIRTTHERRMPVSLAICPVVRCTIIQIFNQNTIPFT